MLDNTLHLFVKFHEETNGEFREFKTMEEHLKVLEEKGTVVWGHFTSSLSKKGLWDKRMDIIHKQMKLGKEAFVFFCDRESQLLYVGKYVNSYKKAEVEQGHEIIEYIPKYYHHKVGTPKEYKEDELRSYAYIELCKIIKIDIDDANEIFLYKEKENEPKEAILGVKGMASIMYVNIEKDLYEDLSKQFQDKIDVKLSRKDLEVLEELEYQDDVENIEVDDNIIINDKPEEVPTLTEGTNGKKRPRSARRAKNSIVLAKYQCEADSQHKSFTTKLNKSYVEAHHLVPMEFQDDFAVSLDVEANIISLCPLCHSRLHHAIFEEKIDTLKKLYEVRKERLEKCGIKVSLKELYEFYK